MTESAIALPLTVLRERGPQLADSSGPQACPEGSDWRAGAPPALAREGLPALRLLPAPTSEPPFDDERAPRPVLRLVPAPLVPVPAPSRRPPVRSLLLPEAAPRRTRTATDALPDARPFAQALVQRLLEVCGGVRPVPQLQRDTTPGLYAELERALTRRPRPTGPRPSSRDVRSVHVQERPDGVAEVCATVRRGDRICALAMRLEGVQGRWLCTQIHGV